MAKRFVITLALFAVACSSDDDASDGGGQHPEPDAADQDAGDGDGDGDAGADSGGLTVLPSALMLDGTAEAEDGEDRVECRFFGTFEQLERGEDGAISGTFIGEIIRTTYTGGGMFEFIPLVGGPATITPIDGGEVELRFVGDQPDDALDFWLELEVVTGEDMGGFRYGGEWRCAPGLLDDPGFMDIDLTATGTWTLMPAR